MWKYSRFILSIIIKKKSLYFCYLLLCFSFFGLFYPSINSGNNNFKQSLFPISTFTKWFPFVFSTIFSSLIIIRLFKIGETDGTELLISAKPIKRWEIIISKFFVLVLMIILFHIFLLPFYFAISQLDNYASQNEKLQFSFSMITGGIIVTLIMSTIIVIISAFIGKVGTIIIGIILATATPIFSFVIVPIAKAVSPSEDQNIENTKENPVFFLSETKKTNSIYDPKKQIKTPTKSISIFDFEDKKTISDNKNSWYNYAKYFDYWYQLGRFYSLIGKTSQTTQDSFSYSSLVSSYQEIKKNEFDKIIAETRKTSILEYIDKSNNREYIGLFSKKELEFEKKHIFFDKIEYKKMTKKDGSLLNFIKKIETNMYSDESVIGEEYYWKLLKELNKTRLFINNQINFKYLKYFRILFWRMINEYQLNNPFPNNIDLLNSEEFDINKYNLITIPWINRLLFYSSNKRKLFLNINDFSDFKNDGGSDFKNDGRNFSYKIFTDYFFPVFNYEEKHHLKTIPIITFWGIISGIFIIIAIVIYLRKDFK